MMTTCTFCYFVGSHSDVIKHSVTQHSNHPSFFLTCDACGGTYKKYDSFRKHVLRKHPKGTTDLNAAVSIAPGGSIANICEIADSSSHFHTAEKLEGQLVQQSASYILKMKSVYGLSQTCINDIIQHTNSITHTATAVTRERILGEITQDANIKEALDENMTDWNSVGTVDVFTGIDSKYEFHCCTCTIYLAISVTITKIEIKFLKLKL